MDRLYVPTPERGYEEKGQYHRLFLIEAAQACRGDPCGRPGQAQGLPLQQILPGTHRQGRLSSLHHVGAKHFFAPTSVSRPHAPRGGELLICLPISPSVMTYHSLGVLGSLARARTI